MVGSLNFNHLQLINSKETSELEGFWSDGANVHVCLSGVCSIKNIEICLHCWLTKAASFSLNSNTSCRSALDYTNGLVAQEVEVTNVCMF